MKELKTRSAAVSKVFPTSGACTIWLLAQLVHPAGSIVFGAIQYQTVLSFGLIPHDGNGPYGRPVEGKDAALYGTTLGGGANDGGTVFKLQKDGSAYLVLHSFGNPLSSTESDGFFPYPLMAGSDGALYGMTRQGGSQHVGSVFKVNPNDSSYAIVHNFTIPENPNNQDLQLGLVEAGPDGALYGGTSAGIFKMNKDGSGLTFVHLFTSPKQDGELINWVMQSTNGALFGTTGGGGTNLGGTLFTFNPDGSGFTILHHFETRSGLADVPNGVVEGTDGLLYGTTQNGGDLGLGSVFRIGKDGSGFMTVHSFTSSPGDAKQPYATVIQGSDGFLYGTTDFGGTNNLSGALFRLNTDGGSYSVLHSFGAPLFSPPGDGSNPQAPLLQAKDGTFYGSAAGGGQQDRGTVFKFTLSPSPNPQISIQWSGTNLLLTWTGTLESSTNLAAAWVPVTAATSPWNVPRTAFPIRFFRAH